MERKMAEVTPVLRQYLELKSKVGDALLLFQLGDFYEMFFEDAILGAKLLNITLTSRDKNKKNPVPMCGVPIHSASTYIARLVEQGYKVAICDQVEEKKGLFRRELTRIITPGLFLDTDHLPQKTNIYLASIFNLKTPLGLAYIDIGTGQFKAVQLNSYQELIDELSRITPKEIIVPESGKDAALRHLIGPKGDPIIFSHISILPDEYYELSKARERLKERFNLATLDGLGIEEAPYALMAIGSILYYIEETQKGNLEHIDLPSLYNIEDYLILDDATIKHLELLETMHRKSRKGSLLYFLDFTLTSMGGRKLREWLLYPLMDKDEICLRQDAVEWLKKEREIRSFLQDRLKKIYDLERLTARVTTSTATPRDLVALKNSLSAIPAIKENIKSNTPPTLISKLINDLDHHPQIISLIDKAIIENPPLSLKEGGYIKKGFHPQLDNYIKLIENAKEYLKEYEIKEQKRTSIPKLKIGYNKVFGYYIEISKSYTKDIPDNYQRKQTLTNAERYVTPELKKFEEEVIEAEEHRIALEMELFLELRSRVARFAKSLRKTAQAVASLDVLQSFAETAEKNRYIKPSFNNKGIVSIEEGRHPVIELTVGQHQFVPNTINMDDKKEQILIITGPNMSGKSTILRQVALIVLMAQMGSFVPALKVDLPIFDRIFTRVGASDDLTKGQSTFMVEMVETARILHMATPNSLVILDEIGRGTSTYDGLSIAWAVAEYLHDAYNKGIKTLFATHYHELVYLEKIKMRVKTLNVQVKEEKGDIIFIYRLATGGASKSYGVQVARLAGIPEKVIKRALEILKGLEKGGIDYITDRFLYKKKKTPKRVIQYPLFSNPEYSNVIELIKNINPDTLTPIEALNTLYEIKKKLQN